MKTFLLYLFTSICLFGIVPAGAQCTTRVTHLSGTQLVDCTNVTVTAQGGTSSTTACGTYPVFPYWVGIGPTGSYTFVFDPPISGFTLDLYGLNNTNGEQEEIVMEINGVLTPFTDAGVGTGCLQPTVLFGGAIRACVDCLGSGRDIHVNQSITTLKIENTVLAGGPNGTVFSMFICCGSCATDAGLLTNTTLNLCGENSVATLSPATQTQLEPNDLLQYILFTDLNDTLGSVVATNNTAPVFSFNPATMTYGVTYYIASVAGNNLGGSVDPNDPCLDFSNPVAVEWNPEPEVALSAASELCENECSDIEAIFTGSPPFTLDYSTPWGNFTQTFATTTATFQVCAPVGVTGAVVVQATGLTDANCACD